MALLMQRFGEKLRTLREREGMTMRELASALDLTSHGTISDLERGRLKPSTQLTIKIARFFNVSIDRLLLNELELD